MPEDTLTLEEKDVIGELGNISMGAAATALSTILGRRVEITVPRVEVINKEEVADLLPEKHIVVKCSLPGRARRRKPSFNKRRRCSNIGEFNDGWWRHRSTPGRNGD